jgi:hypothetical protein
MVEEHRSSFRATTTFMSEGVWFVPGFGRRFETYSRGSWFTKTERDKDSLRRRPAGLASDKAKGIRVIRVERVDSSRGRVKR